MRWRIYYGDGSTYEGETLEDALAAPTTNAVILKQECHAPDIWRGYTLRHTFSFLVWENIIRSGDGVELPEGRWGSKNDIFGLMDYFTYRKGPMKIVVGREIHDETFQALMKLTSQDGCVCANRPACGHKSNPELGG